MPKVTIEGNIGMEGEMQLAMNMVDVFSTSKSPEGTVVTTSDLSRETREQLIARLEGLGLTIIDK